jgi:hypothetical protein
MHHHLPRLAGLVAILATFALVPAAMATSPSTSSSTTVKERAYGKHCGAKSKARHGARTRTKCLKAMAKLADGTATTPSKACRGLSRTRAKGEHKSAFARCVVAGARLLKAAKRAARADGDDADSEADDEGDDSLEESDPIDPDSSLDDRDDDFDPFAASGKDGDGDDE